jgi:hypothetical protein
MSFVIYFAMLVAALVSVVMGLEVVSAPPVRTAARPALVEPIRHQAAPAQPAAPVPSVAQQPAMPAPQPPQTSAQAPEQAEEQGQAAPAPACNIDACAAAYRSFTASDCTYQPFDGPRRLCTK